MLDKGRIAGEACVGLREGTKERACIGSPASAVSFNAHRDESDALFVAVIVGVEESTLARGIIGGGCTAVFSGFLEGANLETAGDSKVQSLWLAKSAAGDVYVGEYEAS